MKRFLTLLHDVAIAGLAIQASLWLRYGLENLVPPPGSETAALVFMAVAAVVFWAVGLPRGMWRFASAGDVRQIVIASSIAILAFLVAYFLLGGLEQIPRSTPLTTWFILIVLLSAPRIVYRWWKDGTLDFPSLLRVRDGAENLLIVGSAAEADQAIRTYNLEQSTRYNILGIVDYNGRKVGRQVRGVRILGSLADLPQVVESLRERGLTVSGLLATAPRSARERLREVTNAAVALSLPVRRAGRAPDLADLEPDLEAITLDDLLGRTPASLDLERMAGLVQGQVVLVTGAGGSIGSEVVRQVAARKPSRLVLVDHSEFLLYEIDRQIAGSHPELDREALLASVRDRDRIGEIFRRSRPAVVFHAAALKHVPLVEANVCEGVLTNVVGTKNIADAALEVQARAMVMISTDKAIRPTSVMGATKRAAEAYCQALDASGSATRFVTVRFGNVLGSAGSVVPLFKEQIAAGGPVTVTHPEMKRYFMTIREATELVLQAATVGIADERQRGRIFVLDMGEPVKIVDLARTMIALAGYRPEIDISVRFTGLRPGEKLFEELFEGDEETVPTAADGVFVASARLMDRDRVTGLAGRLERAARAADPQEARELLEEIVGAPIGPAGEPSAVVGPTKVAAGAGLRG